VRPSHQDEFRRYLSSIPDELLVSVAEDCVWVAGLLASDAVADDYRFRVAACLEEERRRGWPQLLSRSSRYSPASANTPSGAQAASAGGNWLTSPIFSNNVPIPQ